MRLVELNKEKELYEKRFIDLMCYCFKMCTEEDFRLDWLLSTPDRETILGLLDEEVLASCITIPYKTIYIEGKPVSMAGVGGVTTASTYRSGGVCSRLIQEGLKVMYEKGAVFSMLAPFSYEFYQKLGWKWCYNNMQYVFEVDRLKRFKNEGHISYVTAKNEQELKDFYEAYIKQLNGSCIRDDVQWGKRTSKKLDHYTVLYRNDQGQVEGYMIYKIVHEKLQLEVVEMQYTSMKALRSFFNYIYVHNAQVTTVSIEAKEHDLILDVLPNPRCEAKLISYMMGRIVNVVKALECYNFIKEGTFIIQVEDDICEWNNGYFKVTIKANQVEVQQVQEKPDFKIDVRELMQLIIGFKTLKDIDKVKAVEWYQNKEHIMELFKATRSEVALYDYF